MKILTLILLLSVFGLNVQAESIRLISIRSEAEPNKVAYLGVNTDSKNKIVEVFYENDEGSVRDFTPASLFSPKAICTKSGYNLVTMKVAKYTATSVSLSLNYSKNVFGSETGTKRYSIRFNAPMNRYEMYDENQRQISSGFVTTHRNMIGMAVGIEDIRTQ